tara:strand:+ start:1104 stop:1535 length:432 start_codon:yes stop_codon:yes gene_type:complete
LGTKIRLSRGGTKKRPHYRVVIADVRSPRDGRFIERVGTYNPLLSRTNPERIKLNSERIKYWLSQGAVPTERVARFLGSAEIIPMPKQKNNPKKSIPKSKAREKKQDSSEAESSDKETKNTDDNKTDVKEENTEKNKDNETES